MCLGDKVRALPNLMTEADCLKDSQALIISGKKYLW